MIRWPMVRAVISREYLQRVRSRAFILSTLLVPLFMVAIVLATFAWSDGGEEGDRGLLLLDRTGVLAEGLVLRLQESGFRVDLVEPDDPGDPEALIRRLELGPFLGLLELDDSTLAEGRGIWRGWGPPPPLRALALRQALVRTVVEVRLETQGDGASVTRLLDGGELLIQPLEGVERLPPRVGAVALATGGGFALYMVILIYGTMLLRAVLEEKTGRIAEVLLASLRPWELMLGKVLGVGAVGLTQLGVWLAMAAGAGAARLAALPPGVLPTPGVLAYFVVSFVLGYFLYASLFAAVGAICSTEEEAQQAQFPVVMLVIVPVILLFPVMEDPHAPASLLLSLVPFFAPVLMFARVALDAAAGWEAALAVALTLGTLLLTSWAAGRIYRVGILMQGKRPTLPEVWKWIRQP